MTKKDTSKKLEELETRIVWLERFQVTKEQYYDKKVVDEEDRKVG